MNRCLVFLVGGLLPFAASFSSPASAGCLDDLFLKYADAQSKSLSRAGLDAMSRDPSYQKCIASTSSSLTTTYLAAATKPSTEKSAAAAAQPAGTVPPLPPAIMTSTTWLLRQGFNDIWLFNDPSKTAEAQGATFSYTSDRVAQNNSWTVHAMGSVVFQYYNNRYGAPDAFNFIGLSLAPYVQIDRITNSNLSAQKNNVDEITSGGSAEAGFDMLGGANYFRLSGAGVDDQIANKTSGLAELEWIPVYRNLYFNFPFGLPNIPVIFVFGPELKVRYDDVVVNDTTGAKEYLWRYGPQLALRYRLDASYLPSFLQSISGQTTFSWLDASEITQSYSYFMTSLSYNLDKDNHVALSGSYTKGRSEQIGRQIDLWQTGLNAKW